MGIESYSTTPASNNSAPPNGISGSDLPSALDNVQRQIMADVRSYVDTAEWFERVKTPTYVSATSFTIPGSYASIYHAGRRVKCYGSTMGTLYGTISSSSYSSPNTTVNVIMDGGSALTSNLSIVYLSSAAVSSASVPLFVSNPWPNLIAGGNSDLNPWQRGTSIVSPAGGAYTADLLRWDQSGSGAVTVSKDATPIASTLTGMKTDTMYKVTITTADASLASTDYYGLSMFVEGYDWLQVGHAYPLTLSFWFYGSLAGTYCVSFINSGGDRCYVAEYTITAAPQFVTITIPAFATSGTWNYVNGVGLRVHFSLGAGSNYVGAAGASSASYLCTSNQVNFMADNTYVFRISQIRLNPGPSPSTLSWEPLEQTRRRCMRRYQTSYNAGAAPGAVDTSGMMSAQSSTATTSIFNLNRSFPVTMLTVPTIAWYSPNTGDAIKIYNNRASSAVAVSSTTGTGTGCTGYPVLSSACVAGDSFFAHFTATGDF